MCMSYYLSFHRDRRRDRRRRDRDRNRDRHWDRSQRDRSRDRGDDLGEGGRYSDRFNDNNGHYNDTPGYYDQEEVCFCFQLISLKYKLSIIAVVIIAAYYHISVFLYKNGGLIIGKVVTLLCVALPLP